MAPASGFAAAILSCATPVILCDMSDAASTDAAPKRASALSNIQSKIIVGALTVLPVAAVWFVVTFLVDFLVWAGRPLVLAVADGVEAYSPAASEVLHHPWVVTVLAVLAVLWILYLAGVVASNVLGRRFIGVYEMLLERVPLVRQVYGATKKLVDAIQQKPDGLQRVVLIDFPNAEMRAIGFVTKTFRDATSGKEYAAVYVPTTPNPTSGYLEIVPVERCTSTDLTMDEAMNMILSGGATAPAEMKLTEGLKPGG